MLALPHKGKFKDKGDNSEPKPADREARANIARNGRRYEGDGSQQGDGVTHLRATAKGNDQRQQKAKE